MNIFYTGCVSFYLYALLDYVKLGLLNVYKVVLEMLMLLCI